MLKKIFICSFALFVSIFLFRGTVIAEKDTLTVGRVTDNPKKHYPKLESFINYLVKNLNDPNIKEGKVLFAKNNQQLIKYLKEGKIDIMTETPYSTIIYMEKGGAKPLLRRWKKGLSSYGAVIFARKDSGINSLKDLKGKVIAFEDPGSTSGYFLPKTAIMEVGLEMIELANYKETPPADKVGYCFAHGEPNIAHWVHKGMVAAGSLSNLEYEEPDEVPTGILIDFKVLHKTKQVPRNIISVSKDMDPKIVESLKQIMLAMDKTEEGKNVMWKMTKTFKFDEFPEGVNSVIKAFRQKYSLIEAEIDLEYPEGD